MTTIASSRTWRWRPDVSLRALRVWQRNRDVYLRLWRSELVWPLAEPIISLLALGIGLGGLVELPSGQRYIEFIAPGLLAVFPMWAAAGECAWGSFFRRRPCWRPTRRLARRWLLGRSASPMRSSALAARFGARSSIVRGKGCPPLELF